VFTLLLEQLYLESQSMQSQLRGLLITLLRRTHKNSLTLISTIIRTVHLLSWRTKRVFMASDLIKEVGLSSYSYFQSLMMLEDGVIMMEEGDEVVGDLDDLAE
jgi:hypothetical protein